MRAIVYDRGGASNVLHEVTRPVPDPLPGEVRVRVGVSGVNPTDWKARRDYAGATETVPNQDGSGVVDAVGDGVDPALAGRRVWLWEAARQRLGGTAQEYVVVPQAHAVPLPDGVGLDHGACLGVPAITAHRCLTVAEGGPAELAPGALAGRVVLVAGGAGAVGHAAIQLARWSGATVLATVSSDAKAALARAAGADHAINYREPEPAKRIREIAPTGVDVVAEVAVEDNAALDSAILAPNGTVAIYAGQPGARMTIAVRDSMSINARWQFVLIYTMPAEARRAAVAGVSAALAAGALPIGEASGLPLHRFPLERTADAHDAVEQGTVGKVLIDVAGTGG